MTQLAAPEGKGGRDPHDVLGTAMPAWSDSAAIRFALAVPDDVPGSVMGG